MENYLEFEKPIEDLRQQIIELKSNEHVDLSAEISNLEDKCLNLTKEIFSKLTIWEKVQLARHPQRPYSNDYINLIADDFIELHGDRLYGEDGAIISGIAKIGDKKVVIIGEQKGRDVEDNILKNFGMPHPEGYRKALRIMKLGEKFGFPVITFIDTPGAYPGIGAEERGQAEAIARNLREMSILRVPIISIVIGEGGSGGALAIGVGDVLAMLEYTIYSVISPEGCASILWRDASAATSAAESLKLFPEDLQKLEIIDKIIPEALGGAHRDKVKVSSNIKKFIIAELNKLEKLSIDELLDKRYKKIRKIGEYNVVKNAEVDQ
ncbi:acetyl-CoA carboxylase carboxyltransferase subunit alpha [bacterium]